MFKGLRLERLDVSKEQSLPVCMQCLDELHNLHSEVETESDLQHALLQALIPTPTPDSQANGFREVEKELGGG